MARVHSLFELFKQVQRLKIIFLFPWYDDVFDREDNANEQMQSKQKQLKVATLLHLKTR